MASPSTSGGHVTVTLENQESLNSLSPVHAAGSESSEPPPVSPTDHHASGGPILSRSSTAAAARSSESNILSPSWCRYRANTTKMTDTSDSGFNLKRSTVVSQQTQKESAEN
ncbi:hypothetical protein AAHE18_11G140900 [Arachis hypogaea]